MSEPTTELNLTANESRFIVEVMQNLTGDIQFDAAAVAVKLNIKDAGVVRARWNTIKRTKLMGGVKKAATPKKRATIGSPEAEGNNDGQTDTPAKTPKKRGRPAKAKGDGEAEGDAPKTPKKRGRPATAAKVAEAEADPELGEGEVTEEKKIKEEEKIDAEGEMAF